MNAPSWKRRALGFSLLFLGVLGLVLPVLQGGLLLALGLFVLRDQYAWSRRWLGWLHKRWPAPVDGLATLERKLLLRCREWGVRLRRLLSWRR
ncbi:PGPGW domain-containing protein [Pseudoroseomonas globiformis]|uniref:PGPGW domain-containing protein n=1 Tax=Teichococcus globiformis TaxID=2307229 RepID=A0ABV7FW66_9PROT